MDAITRVGGLSCPFVDSTFLQQVAPSTDLPLWSLRLARWS